MQTISEIRALLDERGLRPKHALGQNFLHDKNQIRKLLDAAKIQPGDVVLEVGPGTGTLTEGLLEAGADVVACELDAALADLLRERIGDRIMLIEGDCLAKGRTLSPQIVDAIDGRRFKLVANLPYQIASPLIAALLIDHENCAGQFVTIQKEVVDRLAAEPNNKTYGPLGVIVQSMANVERIGVIKPASFWPQPKVTSAMASVIPKESLLLISAHERRQFARFNTELFSKRRKQIGAIFGRDREWPTGVSADQRPEMLAVSDLIALFRLIGGEASSGKT